MWRSFAELLVTTADDADAAEFGGTVDLLVTTADDADAAEFGGTASHNRG